MHPQTGIGQQKEASKNKASAEIENTSIPPAEAVGSLKKPTFAKTQLKQANKKAPPCEERFFNS